MDWIKTVRGWTAEVGGHRVELYSSPHQGWTISIEGPVASGLCRWSADPKEAQRVAEIAARHYLKRSGRAAA
jgi:putative methionine-R-sulfoxide reductase with GAF domain